MKKQSRTELLSDFGQEHSTKTTYVSLSEINDLQTAIMHFITHWVHTEKTPVPLREIIEGMTLQGVHDFTTIKAIQVLLNKGYIRRAIVISNRSSFVQLRSVL